MSYRCAADEGKANDAPIQARQVPDSCAAPITQAPLSDDSSANMPRSASEEFAIDTIYPSSPANDRAIDACWPEHAARPPPPQRMPSRIGRNLANRVVMLLSDPLQYKIGNRFHSADEIPELELDREAEKLRQALRDGAADYNVDVELQVRIATADLLRSAVTLGARVIHFAGHSMMFEDGHGSAKQLEPETLRLLVSAGGAGACRLVVVNSCQSEKHGRAFVDAGVEHVVAVAQNQNDGRITDRAARAFCRSFYLSLVSGDSVQRAFEVGCASAQEKMTGPLATQRLFVLLPEDKPHDVPIFSPIPGTFRETTPPPVPSNALAPPTFYVGRAYDQLKCVESIIRYRLTTIGGLYGSGKSALAASAAAYASRRRRFDAVVWVEATTQERFFDDVAEAAAHVIEKVQRDAVAHPFSRPTLRTFRSTLSSSEAPSAGGRVRRRSRTWSLDDNGSLEDGASGLDTSALADLAKLGKVLVVLNDFERLVVSVPRHQLEARARCRRLLSSVLQCGGARCSSNIRVLLTCSSGSGIGLVPGVTENVISLGPLKEDKTALMLLYRDRELLRRAHDPYAPLPPKIAPRPVVAMCALHPLMKRLNGLPRAVDLAVRILNLLFAAEEAAKDACEAAGASKMKPPQSLEPLDRVLRVLDDDDGEREIRVAKRLIRKIGGGSDSLREGDKVEADHRGLGKFYPGKISRDRGDDTYDISYEQKLEESDLRQNVDELNYMVQHGRGYRPDGTPVSPASPASPWTPPPEFQLDSPVSPSTVASPASPWALGPSVEPRQLAIALAAVWGVRLAADAAERGALDALVLNVRLDALVHLVLDVLAVALLYEARR